MTILHYIPSIDEASGGVGAYMQLLTRDLGKLCELHVVTHRSEKMRPLENCQLHFIPESRNPFSSKGKKEFVQILEELRPDVFHSNCCWMPMSALTVFWCQEWRTSHLSTINHHPSPIRIVYTPHGMLEPWIMNRHYWTKKVPASLLYQKKAVKEADLIHATAESEKENLLRLGWNRNIHVIGNCVQLDKIQCKFQMVSGVSDGFKRSKNILFLSRVHPKKGINFLIEAVGRLRGESPELIEGYTITIAGPGEDSYVQELKDLAVKNGVMDMFSFIGSVYGDDKWPLYRKADLFVLPTHSENFGIVVAEALASGTPVITTTGTPWHELNEYHCGWWTGIGTEPLLEALHKFLACSDEELSQMGQNGRRLIEEKYSSVSIAKQFMEMYRNIAWEM